jgi:hypothetical protein
MSIFDGQSAGESADSPKSRHGAGYGADEPTMGDKAQHIANQVGGGLAHFGQSVWHKAKDVANSEEVNLAGHATRDALMRMRNFAGEKIDLSHNPLLTDKDLSLLSGVRTLTHIDLGFNPRLTDNGLVHLTGNQNLKHLNLENTLITGATFALLPHAALVSLVLRNDHNLHVTALNHLTHMQRLNSLDLSGNRQIDDTSVKFLRQLSQVKDMDLRGTGLSAHAIHELRKALPNTTIRY